ncbi:MAG TPA: apolipoprotein N-acyltransferase [Alphaproteobacteria bacterium]|nr:apolipoprotein N-acyltransferase [Alphaproteobacteria bacterium]
MSTDRAADLAQPSPAAAAAPWLAAAAGGALYCLAFVGFGVWPLIAVFLVPFWWAVEGLRERGWLRVALAGLVFGTVAHTGGHAWLLRLVEVFLGGDRLLGATLFVVHGLWFATGFAAYALAFAWARRRGVAFAIAAIAPMIVLEWVQVQIFPVHAGSALSGVTRLVQIADLGGPLLLSTFVLAIGVTVYETLAWLRGVRPRPLGAWIGAATLVVAVLLYGAVRTRLVEARIAEAPVLRVGLVQANLAVLEKRTHAREGHAAHVELTRALLAEAPLDLVVWPETAELRAIRGPLPVSGRLVAEDLDVPLLFGGTLVHSADGRRVRANSAFLVAPDGMIHEAYQKNLLIPLAEWVPGAGVVPALAERLPHVQAFRASTETPALTLDGLRIVTPICYEAVRPGFVRTMVEATNPHLLVTLANDAWFGDSQEPWMHLQLARLRAVEHRRFLVRATNSGISALVDPLGRIVARTDLLARQTLHGVVHPLAGRTLYARLGDWPGPLAAAVFGAAMLWPRRSDAGARGGPRTSAAHR